MKKLLTMLPLISVTFLSTMVAANGAYLSALTEVNSVALNGDTNTNTAIEALFIAENGTNPASNSIKTSSVAANKATKTTNEAAVDILGIGTMLKKWVSHSGKNIVVVVDNIPLENTTIELCGQEAINNKYGSMMAFIVTCPRSYVKSGFIGLTVYNFSKTEVKKLKVSNNVSEFIAVSLSNQSGVNDIGSVEAMQDSYPSGTTVYRKISRHR